MKVLGQTWPGKAVQKNVKGLFHLGALGLCLVASGPLLGQINPLDQGEDGRGQCFDILPPGQSGCATLAQLLDFKISKKVPFGFNNQLGMYSDLIKNYHTLDNQNISKFFMASDFGVEEKNVLSKIHPRQDVEVVRDKFNIPHITGKTREGAMFGAGWVAAEDRLWLMDVFRHLGRSKLTGFAGGAPANRTLEQSVWTSAPYLESELNDQFLRLKKLGPRGELVALDIQSYLEGVNAKIADMKRHKNWPGEYNVTHNVNGVTGQGIEDFIPGDLMAIAGLIGGLFGTGGGNEMQSAAFLSAAQEQFGSEKGMAIYNAFRSHNDPEADLTVTNGTAFPYAEPPLHAEGLAIPDKGTVIPEPLIHNGQGTAAPGARRVAPLAKAESHTGCLQGGLEAEPDMSPLEDMFCDGVLPGDLFKQKRGMSNAILVSGKYTDTGHPIAVFGPQTGYFAPQLLMLQEIQGPGISARGVAFAGLNFYVQMGRGKHYAWSATSALQDVTDVYAVPLVKPDGTPGDLASQYYLFRGQVRSMEELVAKNAWKPSLADSTKKGSYDLVIKRTPYGLVTHRGLIKGKPYAFASLRSTYMKEGDSLIGFQMFNDPDLIRSPESFMEAASNIAYTFNWFYIDANHIAYQNSGLNPVRQTNVDPGLPVLAGPTTEWVGYRPEDFSAQWTSREAHPHCIGQDYLVSWNNKQALRYTSSSFDHGPVHRSNLLTSRMVKALKSGEKLTRANMISVMADAAIADLRGQEVLPLLLRVLEGAPLNEPEVAKRVEQLKAWQAAGALREAVQGKRVYQHVEAIKVMDAWWPLLMEAQFKGGMGESLYKAFIGCLIPNEAPADVHHKGSAFQFGWWGFVQKDLRQLLGLPVAMPLGMTFVGAGDKTQAQKILLETLTQAIRTPLEKVYPGDKYAKAGDQFGADAILHSPMGGIEHALIGWQNRPTYQQVIQFGSRQ